MLVLTENRDGKFPKTTFELLSYAYELSTNLNKELVVVSIGNVEESELQKLSDYGASKIINVKDERLNTLNNVAYVSLLEQLIKKYDSKYIILANSFTGKSLAPGLSVRMKAGLAAGVIDLPLSYEPFTVRRKVFNGKALANVIIKTDIKILTLFANSFGLKQNKANAVIEEFNPLLSEKDFQIKVLETDKQKGKIILSDAEIVVSGGRGMKGPENWGPIIELANLLGAATACSRPVSDEGWRPIEEHTGQTGKIIAPNLYIACGISGAMQHLAGISSSKYIVAINKDPEAPIFQAADYGIVGDVQKVLPELINAVKEFKKE